MSATHRSAGAMVRAGLAMAAGVLWGAALGCGGGHAAPAAIVPPPDACQLLTSKDVETVTRDVAGSLSSTLDDAVGRDPSLCTYALAGQPPKVISLAVRQSASVEQAAERQEATQAGLRSLGPAAPVVDVQGLGEGAFWVGGQIDQLHVLRGNLVLIVTAQLDQDQQRAAQGLAARVLARLAHPAPARPHAAPPAARPPAAGSAPPQTPREKS